MAPDVRWPRSQAGQTRRVYCIPHLPSDDTHELAVAARSGDDGGALAAAARMPQLGFGPLQDKKRELRLELERLRDDVASTTQTAAINLQSCLSPRHRQRWGCCFASKPIHVPR